MIFQEEIVKNTIRKIGKRALSMALALELFCAPVAMAYANEELDGERRETPTLEEPAPAPGVPSGETSEVPTVDGNDPEATLAAPTLWTVYCAYGFDRSSGRITTYGRNLREEVSDTWSTMGRPATTSFKLGGSVGRVPDMEFDTFYVVPSNRLTLSGTSWTPDITKWTFGDLLAGKDDDELAKLRLTQMTSSFNTWRLATSYPGVSGTNLALVGHWVFSGRNDLTGLGLSYGEGGDKVEIQTAYRDPIDRTAFSAFTADQLTDLTPAAGKTFGQVNSVGDDAAAKSWKQVTTVFNENQPDEYSEETEELWVRLPKGQDYIDLTFEAYEPFIHYLMANGESYIGSTVTDDYGKLWDLKTLRSVVAAGGTQPADGQVDCPVQVTASFGGTDLTVGDLTGYYTPFTMPVEQGASVFGDPGNSASNPARSVWSTRVSGLQAADGENYYNDIKIRVTAPNKVATRTYIIHVERQTTPTASLPYGNTPAGLIAGNDHPIWETFYNDAEMLTWCGEHGYGDYASDSTAARRAEVNRAYALAWFTTHLKYHDTLYPQLSVGTFRTYTYTGVWGMGKNYDLDKEAIVVYQDSAFADPGVSFTDSEGNPVVFGAGTGDYESAVTRTLKLLTADQLTTDLYGVTTAGASADVKEHWYVGSGGDGELSGGAEPRLNASAASQVLKKADGSDQIDLRGMDVVPGIYTITYTYTDPYASPNLFEDADAREVTTKSRTLIVLPIPGDVDMDGAVTTADAVALAALSESSRWSLTNPAMMLAKYRVFDVNHDTNVTVSRDAASASDVVALYEGFQPQWIYNDGNGWVSSDYYYPALPQGEEGTRYARKSWSQLSSTTASSMGALTLEYMGVERGEWITSGDAKGAMKNPTGPWNISEEDKTTPVALLKDNPATDEDKAIRDTFWMGVKLDPKSSELKNQAVKEFTLTLIYDSRYVEPVSVYTGSELGSMAVTDKARWEFSIGKYNLDYGGTSGTIWNNAYSLTPASTWARTYDPSHYSKVIPEMELELKRKGNNDTAIAGILKELVFSVRSDSSLVTLTQEGYLLAVPFRLKAHPPEQANTAARLIELGAGMRDFNMVADKPTVEAVSVFAALFSLFSGRAAGSSAVTSAFSAQDTIYGDATENLRSELDYDINSGMVLLGSNNTARTVLLNEIEGTTAEKKKPARYDEEFRCTTLTSGSNTVTGLPPGLQYNSTTGVIQGIPTQAGEYIFTIQGVVHYIKVEKRVLHYYAENKSSYYGQPELRGTPSQQPKTTTVIGEKSHPNQVFSYTYNKADIADRDLRAYFGLAEDAKLTDADRTNYRTTLSDQEITSGAGPILKALINENFEAPTFEARDDEGNVVSQTSQAIPYSIYGVSVPLTSNYEFVFVKQGILSIKQRPVQVHHVIADADVNPSAQIFHDEGTQSRTGLVAGKAYSKEGADSLVVLTIPSDAQDMFDDIPLWGPAAVNENEITVTFEGTFQTTDADAGAPKGTFTILTDKELRPISVSNVELSGTCALNYELKGNEVTAEKECNVQGWVLRRAVTGIKFYSVPTELQGRRVATYGDKIYSPLRVAVQQSNAQVGAYPDYAYSADTLKGLGVHFNWVTPEEKAAGEADTTSLIGTGRYMGTAADVAEWKAAASAEQLAAANQWRLKNPGKTMVDYVTGLDRRGYNEFEGGYLSPKMSGWYLCISANKYGSSGDGEYFKVYSVYPLQVKKKDLRVTVEPMTCFYGEFPYNPADPANSADPGTFLTYSYAWTDLANAELNKIPGGVTNRDPETPGTREELELVLGSSFADKMKLEAMTSLTGGTAVTQTTDCGNYTIKLSSTDQGNEHENYNILYTLGSGYSSDYGTESLTINPRPILVDFVTAPGDDGNFATIYADTKSLVVDHATLLSQKKGIAYGSAPTTAAMLKAEGEVRSETHGLVTFKHPALDAEWSDPTTKRLEYWDSGSTDSAALHQVVSPSYLTEDAVLSVDLGKLWVEYRVAFRPDRSGYWQSFTNNFYELDDPTKPYVDGARSVDVEVNSLVLKGVDGKEKNYQLVFASDHDAQNRLPAGPTGTPSLYFDESTSSVKENILFKKSGTGTVLLRPIEYLELTHLGRMEYTYGDPFAPNEPQEGETAPMTIRAIYKTEYDNVPNNVHEGYVEYGPERELVGDLIVSKGDSFTLRGFKLYYVKNDQIALNSKDNKYYLTPAAQKDYEDFMDMDGDGNHLKSYDCDWESRRLDWAEYLTPGEHNGAHLLVVGRRGDSDPLVFSQVTTGILKVDKKAITLTATNVHRFYGEDNNVDGAFTFSVMPSMLAVPDILALGILTQAQVDAGQMATVDQTKGPVYASVLRDHNLAGFDSAHTPVIFTDSTVNDRSPVGEQGYGDYPLYISMSAGNKTAKTTEWANYKITNMVNGHIYVYPRPITITGINNGDGVIDGVTSTYANAWPVYTIYSGTNISNLPVEIATRKEKDNDVNKALAILSLYNNEGSRTVVRADGNGSETVTLTLTNTDALVKNSSNQADRLIVKTRVTYSSVTVTAGMSDTTVKATAVAEGLIENDNTARNYKFYKPGDSVNLWNCYGAIKLRTIDYIRVTSPPNKMEYTYGESLDLTGLQVLIRYRTMNGEQEEPTRVPYRGYEDFKSYGLYVNYWDADENGVPVSIPKDSAERKALVSSHRTALTGDHITIAPDHSSNSTEGFVANGKYLIISAFRASDSLTAEEQPAAMPVLVSKTAIGSYYDDYVADEYGKNTGSNRNNNRTALVVNPRKLTYTLTATDKTYDGTTATAGTLTLTNVYCSENDKYQVGGTEKTLFRGTDAVYVRIGADYENQPADSLWNAYSGLTQEDGVDKGGVLSFTTGAYTPNGAAPLGTNGKITWSGGYAIGDARNFLEFHFTNPNVHYEDSYYTNGRPGVGPANLEGTSTSLSQYWAASQAHNRVTGKWDSYNPVSAMPVVVKNMTLQGPDAANYTWEWDEGLKNRVESINVTVDTRADTEDGQDPVPFATIWKANRDTVQALQKTGPVVYPGVQTDRHSNAVYLSFERKLSDMGNNNNAGVADEYRDEIHYEYALFYRDPDPNSLLFSQWAGYDGRSAYQDTRFFGGEAVSVDWPAGYEPNVEQLPKEESRNENTVYKGQLYRWALLDDGKIWGVDDNGNPVLDENGQPIVDAEGNPLFGRPLNDGFRINAEAYPGGAAFQSKYWYYYLYTTDRLPLPRSYTDAKTGKLYGMIYYPLVRVAETHNYNASGCITGDGNGDGADDVTPQDIVAVQNAVNAYRQYNGSSAPTLKSLYETAKGLSDALFNTKCANMTADAEETRRVEMEDFYGDQLGEKSQWPETAYEGPEPSSATKTYLQRIDVLSVEKLRSGDQTDDKDYMVKTLEAVWFTDTLRYTEQRYLDAMLYNHPSRYYGYYYDVDMSAPLTLTSEDALDLNGLIRNIEIRRQLADGTTEETTMTANYDHNLELFAKITQETGNQVRVISLYPSVLVVRLGDEPVQLQVVTYPEKPSNRKYKWITSDPTIATVDADGVVTFRSVGTVEITVKTDNNRKSTCVVTVEEASPISAAGHFNRFYSGSFMELNGDGEFMPKAPMNRGEMILVLDVFCRPEEIWPEDAELAYGDLTKRERYLEALRRLTALGVVEGMPGKMFEGERFATRAEFITAMARFLSLDIIDTRGMVHAFRDAGETDTWAYAYIDALYRAGLLKGTGGGNFRPNDPVTREEVAALLARVLTIHHAPDGEVKVVPADVTPANWSYDAILRAVNAVQMPTAEELKPT